MSEHEHEHEFDGKPTKGRLVCCKCVEWRVGTGKRWRELTANERLTLLAKQMEDLAIADAMKIIHGPEVGIHKARVALGYDQDGVSRRALGYSA